MKKKSIQIEIPKPCHEKWNNMTPLEKGNFCMSCQKVVVDFSNKSDREIGQYFKQSKGNLCGRFRPDQLSRSIPLKPTISPAHQKAWAAAFSGLLLTAGISAQTNPTVEVTAARPVVEQRITGFVVNTHQEAEQSNSQRYIKGVVMDAEFGEPLLGATIVLFNTNIGTSTDIDGRFELLIPEQYSDQINDLSIEVSYVGYETLYINENAFSENMTINLSAGHMIMGAVVMEIPYRDQTLWQSSRRLWNRLQYSNPIRNWIENRQTEKALKAEEKVAKKDLIIPTAETTNDTVEKGKSSIQTTENAAFNLANISPNPFQTQISLDIEMLDAGKLTMSLFTEDGKRVFDRTDRLNKGKQAIQLDILTSNLVAGTYILNIFHENGFQKSEILILQ